MWYGRGLEFLANQHVLTYLSCACHIIYSTTLRSVSISHLCIVQRYYSRGVDAVFGGLFTSTMTSVLPTDFQAYQRVHYQAKNHHRPPDES